MAMEASRFNFASQWEHLQSKYVGTGHGDLTKHEWVTNQKRDTYASFIGHNHILNYFAIVENEAVGRMKYKFQERMILPCGPAPRAEE